MKTIAAIALSNKLKKYRKHAGLNARMPNYKVKMGYGLHMGLGIEGSIGSVYKIDASYLSNSVNMSSRLEGATKGYGTPLLVSGPLIEAMTPKCGMECRKIDRITVKGNDVPMDLYTCDVDIDNLEMKIKVGDVDKH
jgi:class 3 adenylate cyclase